MKLLARIVIVLGLLLPVSCMRGLMEVEEPQRLPKGTPIVLNIGFDVPDQLNVNITTKAESSRADEARVHDLYVMMFDTDTKSETYGNVLYKRYFTYEHLMSSLNALDASNNDGWYVKNSDNSIGVVKIATQAADDFQLVLLANVTNTITTLNHRDAVTVLSQIENLAQLNEVKVTLEQEIVDRADLFLMMGYKEHLSTSDLNWGKIVNDVPTYNLDNDKYQLQLKPLDAKVKFWIKYNEANIDPQNSDARRWQVFNVPSECFLMPSNDRPSDITYFTSQKAYFEGSETIADGANAGEYQVFSFYMLENPQAPKKRIAEQAEPSYYLREKESDASAAEPTFIYAPAKGTFVRFDLLLGLKDAGAREILGNAGAAHALTTEAMYTVHLGQFVNSESAAAGYDWDNYDVNRSTFYNYYITINNSKSIYVEVMGDDGGPRELQPGQEGSLLFSTDAVVNCDAHYSNHSLTFRYTPSLEGKKVSWYVKTPFDEGGAEWIPDSGNPNGGDWKFDCKDYLWVKFGLNSADNGSYSHNRTSYPGDDEYVATWNPTTQLPAGKLMDIHQLFSYILHQTKIRNEWIRGGSQGPDPSAFLPSGDESVPVIRVTAFIDEYYYEKDPTLDPKTATADPNLWRQFVNKDPRELHILSDAQYSADGQSDVITSSHSIIQQSIQTFYNTYSPELNTLWGAEHTDEMEFRIRKAKDNGQAVWPWWPAGVSAPNPAPDSDENGRLNSARIWGVNEGNSPRWDKFLNYAVDNDTPELVSNYQALAYSCLTRNRDNNGNGKIDVDELRWYIASVNQLVGMWVGNEALSPSARIYQPENRNSMANGTTSASKEWRAWIVSSTAPTIDNPRTIRAEEGGTKSQYSSYNWAGFDATDRHQVSSVRCVRNIGTFNHGGKVTDFSYADLEQTPDLYYEAPQGFDSNDKVKPNADGTYTLRFSRLDPRCLREFTSEDLPYTDENSKQNHVYMELHMQDPAIAVHPTGRETQDEINDSITTEGHNNYCPAGYRLPNMTELLLMSALQPSSYWTKAERYPCRTYFSRGERGKKKTAGEDHKIGWGFDAGTGNSAIFHLHNARSSEQPTTITGVRCVRDNNCTGEITGSISIPGGDKLRMGETCNIKLDITSMGSAINSLKLFYVYVDANGSEEAKPISTGNLNTSGVAIQNALVEWTVPTDLTLLGNMSVRAVVTNNAGTRKILEAPIRVLSQVFASVRLLPCDYNDEAENPSFPVMLTVQSPSASITGWRLSIKDPDRQVTSVTPTVQSREDLRWSSTWQYQYTLPTLIEGTYSFQLEVQTSDGVKTKSNIATMDILRVNYHPNPGSTGTDSGDAYHEASDIANKWEPDKVGGMNMAGGDFIEANMDLSTCTYLQVMKKDKPNERDDNRSVGRDNLISIGITDTDHGTGISVPYVYHVYFPAHDGGAESGQDWLRPNISRAGPSSNKSNGTNYKWFKGGAHSGFTEQGQGSYKPDISKKQLFRLERAGAFWNGQHMDTARWNDSTLDGVTSPDAAAASLEHILSSDTFYIGSTQGVHRSRAKYLFVRAVRNSAESNAAGGNVGFNNPVNGGNL